MLNKVVNTIMNKRLLVIDVVGLSPSLLGEHTPHLNKLAAKGFSAPLQGVFPAVTTTAQSAMLTGKTANEHGIVGNGWYFRELAEVAFWKQANALVQGDKVWDELKRRHPNIKISKLFWWYNMYANVDASITPRPHYLADGGKIFDLYSSPTGLHEQIEAIIGKFPFFNFWGPKAGIESSRWIVSAAIEEFKINHPDLQLVYLPHLDYNLQKLGPDDPTIAKDLHAIDSECGRLIDFAESQGTEILVVSEYGISKVDTPIHINRILRTHNFIAVRVTNGFENLDCGASAAFAVADHQIAHIYINDYARCAELKQLLQKTPGIAQVLDGEEKKNFGIDHERAGDLIVIAESRAWFTYYYWLDDDKAPDFARTVDIHRKPGYDPVEMYIDPAIKFPVLKILGKVIKKKLGMRMLMDVIPLDASLIKGSHGRLPENPDDGAILIAGPKVDKRCYKMTDIYHLILEHFSN